MKWPRRDRDTIPNMMTVLIVAAFTIADISNGDIGWLRICAWAVVWIVVGAIVLREFQRR